MGLLSIFSSRKKAEGERSRGAAGSAADVARDAVRESRASSNARSRVSRRDNDDDDGLDPELPQKQRARRRLIGAVVLVGAAVVVLPLVFDSKPRPVTDAVAVQIQDQPVDRGAKVSSEEPKVASRRSAPRAAGQAQALDQGEEVVAANDAPVASASAPAAKPTPPKTVASVTPPADTKPAAKPAQQAATSNTDAKDGKFVLLIGAFASEDRARNWLSKLKAEKIPGYIEHKKVPEKGDLALLRAGPFNDRASAEAAQKRAEQIGLTPKLVQQ